MPVECLDGSVILESASTVALGLSERVPGDLVCSEEREAAAAAERDSARLMCRGYTFEFGTDDVLAAKRLACRERDAAVLGERWLDGDVRLRSGEVAFTADVSGADRLVGPVEDACEKPHSVRSRAEDCFATAAALAR